MMYLGKGTVFSVSGVYDNWKELTDTDFFVTPAFEGTASITMTGDRNASRTLTGPNTWYFKESISSCTWSYDATTGLLTCYPGTIIHQNSIPSTHPDNPRLFWSPSACEAFIILP